VTHLRNMVADSDPGKETTVKISRDGKIKTVEVNIAEMPSEIQVQSQLFENQFRGISVQSLTPQLKDSLNIPKRITGVVITDMDDDSPAEGTLMKNDVIMEINRKRISGIKDYEEAVSGILKDENILILVFRKGSTLYITLSAK